MDKFKIECKGYVTESYSNIEKKEYLVTAENFEVVVTIFRCSGEAPYMGKTTCISGGDKLDGFAFWSELQLAVLEEYNKKSHI